ncbi:MAG: tetratricopeptide repeat protein, partial [Cyanobacteria bacterium J06638_6]
GKLYHQLSQWSQALECYKKALAVFQAIDDLSGVGYTCHQIGTLMLHQHRYDLARRWAALAVQSFSQLGHGVKDNPIVRCHYGAALHLLGQTSYYQGQFSLALKQLEQALTLRHQLRDDVGEALVLVDMGRAYRAQQQYWYALACYESALDIAQLREATFEGTWFEAEVRHAIAQLCRACGHLDLALKHELEALALGHQGSIRVN